MAAIDMIYKKLNEFLGGSEDNVNQIFTMNFPATVLDKKQYDYDTSGMKPSLVENAESLLGNELLDIAEVVMSANQLQLSQQYSHALQSLMPKLDPNLEKLRGKLRDLLQRPTKNKEYATESDYFNHLFKEWVNVKEEWARVQLNKRTELESKYPQDPHGLAEEYDRWYKTVASGYLEAINAAHASVIEVFSPNERELILSVLDSGNGGALQNLRNRLSNAAMPSQTAGYVYPVTMLPADWSQSLDSDHKFYDLLSSPYHLQTQLDNKRRMLANEMAALNVICQDVPDLEAAQKNYDDAQQKYDETNNKLLDSYTDGALLAAKIYLNSKKGNNKDDPKVSEDALKKLNDTAKDIDQGSGKTPKKDAKSALSEADVDVIGSQQKALTAAQSALNQSLRALGEAGLAVAKASASQVMKDSAKSFQSLITTTQEISDLEQQLKLACQRSPNEADDVFQQEDHGRFTLLNINFSQKELSKSSQLDTSFEKTNWGVNLFFASASGESSKTSGEFQDHTMSQETEIDIAMLVTKVEIHRDWFDPGIFKQSGDYFRTSSVPISKGPLPRDELKYRDKVKSYSEAILPSYPTAFLIAKDVTIKFSLQASQVEQAEKTMREHMDAGGGILCFSVSKTKDSSSDKRSFSSFVQGTSAVIRIPGPQILGWVIDYTPEDKSQITSLDDEGPLNQFINAFTQLHQEKTAV